VLQEADTVPHAPLSRWPRCGRGFFRQQIVPACTDGHRDWLRLAGHKAALRSPRALKDYLRLSMPARVSSVRRDAAIRGKYYYNPRLQDSTSSGALRAHDAVDSISTRRISWRASVYVGSAQRAIAFRALPPTIDVARLGTGRGSGWNGGHISSHYTLRQSRLRHRRSAPLHPLPPDLIGRLYVVLDNTIPAAGEPCSVCADGSDKQFPLLQKSGAGVDG